MIDMQMVNKFIEFKNNFKGNPQEMVMNMLQSGKISQAQLDQAQRMATELQSMIQHMHI